MATHHSQASALPDNITDQTRPTPPCWPPPSPILGPYPAGADTVGLQGTMIFRKPPLNSAWMRVVPKADPPLKVARAARGDERVCDDVQHAPRV